MVEDNETVVEVRGTAVGSGPVHRPVDERMFTHVKIDVRPRTGDVAAGSVALARRRVR
jgi:hypothetical protein